MRKNLTISPHYVNRILRASQIISSALAEISLMGYTQVMKLLAFSNSVTLSMACIGAIRVVLSLFVQIGKVCSVGDWTAQGVELCGMVFFAD